MPTAAVRRPGGIERDMAESSFLQSVAAQESLERKSNFSLLEQLIDLADQAAKLPQDSGRQSETGLLSDASLAATLRLWAAARVGLGIHLSRDALVRLIGQDVAAIDSLIQRQVDAVLHAPDFQRLEASWRGLEWLARQVEEANIDSGKKSNARSQIQIRVLSVTKRELQRDQESAVEFDRSAFWRKIYEEEFGTAGGTPYGLLVTDHEFSHHPDDVRMLAGLSETAMAAYAPLLATPSPALLGVNSFTGFESLPPLQETQATQSFLKWRALREREESRFVGMPMPRVLARRGYDGWIGRPDADAAIEHSWSNRSFRYVEQTDLADGSGRLWMSGVWPLAGVIVREFGRSGWFADIRGGSRGSQIGGEVVDLPVDTFPGAETTAIYRGPTETSLSASLQDEIDHAGLIPLSATGHDGRAVFHSNMSLHKPKQFDSSRATANERLSSMLQYVLCVSRFAIYLKILLRDKLGGVTEASKLEHFLNEWIHRYVTPDDQASPEARARMPLRAAEIEVQEDPGTAGNFRVVMRLQPHFQIDRIDSTLRLVSTVRLLDRDVGK